MDLRKFFGGGAKAPPPPTTTATPTRTSQATTTTTPNRTSTTPNKTHKNTILLDSDEEDFPKAMPAKTKVQLPPPVMPTKHLDTSSPKKTLVGGQKKRKFIDSDESYDDSSSDSGSSDSFESDSSESDNSDSDDDQRRRSKKTPTKTTTTKSSSKVTKPEKKQKIALESSSDDDMRQKPQTKKPTAVSRAANTGKATKAIKNDTDDDDDDIVKPTPAKKPRAKKPPAAGDTWATEDVDIVKTGFQPLEVKKMHTLPDGKQIPLFIAQQQGLLVRLPPPLKGQRPKPNATSSCLSTGGGGPNGKSRDKTPLTFVITGVQRSLENDEMGDLIQRFGGKVTGAVSGRTDFLVAGDDPGPSKVNKALEHGTKIIDEDGLYKLIVRRAGPNVRQPAGLFPSHDDDNAAYEDNTMGDDVASTSGNVTAAAQQPPPIPAVATPAALAAVQPPPVPVVKPKAGSLYAKKAALAAASSVPTPQQQASTTTTATTTTTTTAIVSSLPTTLSTMQETQSLSDISSSLPTATSPTTITTTSTTTSTTASAPIKKPSLYAKKTPSASSVVSPTQSGITSTSAISLLSSSSASSNNTTTTTTTTTINGTDNPNQPRIHQPHGIPKEKLPKVATYPGTTENDLWVDRYAPSRPQDIVGNTTQVQEIIEWLQNWYKFYENEDFDNPDYKPPASQRTGKREDDGPPRRAILLAGGPGLGKTTAAKLCAKAAGYFPIEFNASDTRNKASIAQQVGVITNNGTLQHLLGKKKTEVLYNNSTLNERAQRLGNGSVIIMDEVDGASASDRGGVAELIKLIKNTSTPIICICNDARSDKVKSLKNYCKTYTWAKPTFNVIARRMADICLAEDMLVEPRAMEEIVKSTGNDLRAILNYLQMLHKTRKGTIITWDDSTEQKEGNNKDVEKGPFELVPALFRAQTGKEWFNNYLNMAFVDDTFPLFMQECYPTAGINSAFGRYVPGIGIPQESRLPKQSFLPKLNGTAKILANDPFCHKPQVTIPAAKKSIILPYLNQAADITKGHNAREPNEKSLAIRSLSLLSTTADAISEAELLNNAMMNDGNWQLYSLHRALGVVYPGQVHGMGLRGGYGIGFPQLWPKMSTHGKNQRFYVLMRALVAPMTHNSLTRQELIVQYLPRLQYKLILLLTGKVHLTQKQLHELYTEEYMRLWHCEQSTTGPDCVAQLLNYIGLVKDDWDLFNELCDAFITGAWEFTHPEDKKKVNAPTYNNLVDTKTKSALTRALNKLLDERKEAKTRKKGGDATSLMTGPKMLTEEEELELLNNEKHDDGADDDDNNNTKKNDDDEEDIAALLAAASSSSKGRKKSTTTTTTTTTTKPRAKK